jgi:regulator of protease activity HflC (stomatin/prohibitin superfamily)
MSVESVLGDLKGRLGGGGGGGGGGLKRFILPAAAVLVLLGSFMSETAGFVEVEPGEVAVIYNNTGVAIFGERERVVKEQGVITFVPGFQKVDKLDMRPQIFTMEGDEDVDANHVRKLTVRASDGSNFYFENIELHYQLIPSDAAKVIRENGPGDRYKSAAVKVHSREVLRDEFGRYSFLEIADPRTYGEATSKAKEALNARLQPLGIEITNIPPPKPNFDNRVEEAIEARQNADQEVEVQEEKRNKLEQESGRKVQAVEQSKNAEYQQLLAELEAQKQQANNALIAATREADKYFIEKQAEGQALRDEMVTRAKANEIAYRKEAEGIVAKIKAVGDEGPDVLNRVIADHVFPQLKRVSARPYSSPSTPFDIRLRETK